MTKTPFLNLFLLFAVTTLIAFSLVFFLLPDYRPQLIEEDLLVESMEFNASIALHFSVLTTYIPKTVNNE